MIGLSNIWPLSSVVRPQAARWRSTYWRMPPCATYSTSCGVSTRAMTSNIRVLPSGEVARIVNGFFGDTPPAMPSIVIVSLPVSPTDFAS